MRYLDFDGEDISIDRDFDDFLGIGKKGKAKKEEKLGAKASNYTSFDDCMKNKPLLRRKKVWESACKSQFNNSTSAKLNTQNTSDPQQAGLGNKKTFLIIGGVLVVGLIGFLVLRPKK